MILDANQAMLSRRTMLQMLSAATAAAAIPAFAGQAAPQGLSAEDDALLDDMQRRAALFFYEQADAASGQVLDRAYWANTDGKLRSVRPLSSIAATGFGLTTLCIADHRGARYYD